MRRIMKEIVMIVGAWITYMTLLVTIPQDKIHLIIIKIIAIVLTTIICIYLVVNEYRDNKNKVKCKNKKEINEFMEKWINTDGVTTIFSRDMTWGKDERLTKIMLSKSRKKELVLILQQEDDNSYKLKKEGAIIYTYGDFNHTPLSRFTITKTNKLDSQVAIGREINNKHVIEKFSKSKNEYEFHIANDLIQLIMNRKET